MEPERRELLAAVAANPHDDAPRLAYADWLAARGENQRADFIRYQCGVAGKPAWFPQDRPFSPSTLATQLWHPELLELVADGSLVMDHVVWKRGFIHTLRATYRQIERHHGELLALHPIVAVVPTDEEPVAGTAVAQKKPPGFPSRRPQ